MPRINSPAELDALRKDILSRKDPEKPAIAICSGAGCHGLGNGGVIRAFEEEIEKHGLAGTVDIRATGCHGMCEQGPNVVIYPEEIYYVKVTPEDVPEIVKQSVQGKKVVDRLVYADSVSGEKAVHLNEIPFYKYQSRNLIGNNTRIDPANIDDYIGIGGYAALSKALFEMKPEDVLGEVKKANLRGRGGGGFPAGLKWETTRNAREKQKYVIVNGHEGEPGAFMDRAIFTGNPHLVLEGLIIGAYAIGARHGFIYTRHDSKLLKKNIDRALEQAREYGLLGDNILGSGFSFDVEVHFDVGIFVSGESSALMRSIEGRNPEPRPKYIRTSVSGIWDKPSNLNNVETWANVPQIIEKGADWYTGIGTERSKGTKMISLSGNVVNSGVAEVPFGTTLKQIVYDIGGGVPNGKKLKALHFGGAMGGSIPASLIDTPLDFDALGKVGAPIGAGALMVMDEDTDLVKVLARITHFYHHESCGQCTPCREGTGWMEKVIKRILRGEGSTSDLDLLISIATNIEGNTVCALGEAAAWPVRFTISRFRDYFEERVSKEINLPVMNKVHSMRNTDYPVADITK